MPTRTVAAILVWAGLSANAIARGDDAAAGFAGRWETTYGEMNLTVTDGRIEGDYMMGGARCPIAGTIVDGRFEFEYQEPTVSGVGWFELSEDGTSFSGQWHEDGDGQWSGWTGSRLAARPATTPEIEPIPDVPTVGFAGLWETPHGRLRLIERGGYLHGIFADSRDMHDYFSVTVDASRRIEYTPQEGIASYHLTLELSADGSSLQCERWHNEQHKSTWTSTRVEPEPGKAWLVVLEARWEGSLEEGEYTFGEMLNPFFDRTPSVQVRHREFNDFADFERYGSEVAFLAEPVIVCVATHACADGVTVHEHLLGPEFMADVFRFGDNIMVVHYSACLIMAGSISQTMHEQLQTFAQFPISGYGSSVDWAGSAVIEFMYFDLIFNRGMKPEQACAATIEMMPFAGTGHPSPVGEADLRIALPPPLTEVESQYADGDSLSLQFDGRDDYLEIPGLDIDFDSTVTIEAWIQLDANAHPRSVGVPLHLTGPVDLSLWTSGSRDWSVRGGTISAAGAQTTFRHTMTVGNMRGHVTHVAFVWDGSYPALFIDGQWTEPHLVQTPDEWNYNEEARLLIGAALRDGETSMNFRGIIDELRISNTARYSDVFEPAPRLEVDDATIGLYHFDEASSSEVIDSSPYGRTGVIHGATRVPSLLAP